VNERFCGLALAVSELMVSVEFVGGGLVTGTRRDGSAFGD
jgi:hypothetical protein